MSSATRSRRAWHLASADPAAADRLARALHLERPVAELLAIRGWTDPDEAERHLSSKLTALHDPAQLPDMQAAAQRLVRAIRDGEVILVHGDYDVDGVTGTSLLVRLFQLLGAKVAWHIPNRFTDGYAFGEHSIARAEEVGASVVVSVDNGTSSRETIAALAERGIDTVVTDHHEPPLGDLPPAVAIVNPKLGTSEYPFRELCGGAVAFKLAWGVCQELSGGGRVRDDLRAFLVDAMAYVAIATVCDVVPLVDENRILARYGLQSLEATQHAGLKNLLEVCGLSGRALSAEDVGFQIGPRLNASGRLGTAQTAVELLMCVDPVRAKALALELDRLNAERKEIERELSVAAQAAAEPFADPAEWPVLVLAGQGWHQGVIGIVAARLAERFERPAMIIGLDGAEGRGSCRTRPGVDLLDLLHAGADHMLRYGGHAQAAGLEIRADAVDALRDAVNERARETYADGMPEQPLEIDLDLPFEHMTPELMRRLERLAPYGERNAKPTLLSRDLRLAEPPRIVGADRSHLILRLRRGGHELRAIAFGLADRVDEMAMGEPLHLVYSPGWNTFRGETSLQLVVSDFRCGTAAPV